MKIGDKVKIKNIGNLYSSYDVKFKELGFKNQKENPAPVYWMNVEWEIKNIIEHPFDKTNMLHLDYKGCEILMDKDGCELITLEVISYELFYKIYNLGFRNGGMSEVGLERNECRENYNSLLNKKELSL